MTDNTSHSPTKVSSELEDRTKLLVDLASTILHARAVPDKSLVEQGMDSLGVVDLLEALGTHGFTVDYERLLSDAALGTLAQDVGPLSAAGPIILDDDKKSGLLPLSGAQSIWATLETAGWADWCNISLCVSIPAASVAASDVPKIVRKLCDQNDALRMVLVRGDGPKNEVFQKVLPHCHVPVELRDAPRSERDAMRIVEGFEGRVRSPFEPSTEALVMTSDDDGGRHWLCLTMHHVFADRIAMQSLKRQIEAIIAGGDFGRSETPQLGYGDVAVWQSEQAESQRESNLPKPGFVGPEGMPECRLDPGLGLALGDLPTVSFLSPSQVLRLEACAKRLGSTAPTLLQVLFHAVIARLTSGEKPGYALTCQVASNREQHPSLKDLVGCFDTSIPVQMSFDKPDTSKEACKKALKAFTEGYADWADEPRGGWLKSADRAELFTRVPHINVVRLPPAHTPHGVQDHSVQRVQRTHWGALLRVWMPALGHDGVPDQEMRIAAFAEDRALAVALHHCHLRKLGFACTQNRVQTFGKTV
ncbi:MAG: condensation domain-containing protein, partial [Pseudomonadota bacterium]